VNLAERFLSCVVRTALVLAALAAVSCASRVAPKVAASAPPPVRDLPAGVGVTDEIAATHLFLRIWDAPAPPAAVRNAVLRDGGLSESEIQLLVTSANSFQQGTRTLGAQAQIIHEGLRSKTLERADGIQQLRALDCRRDELLTKILGQLRDDLGRDGWNRLETLLHDKIAPTITVSR
jgi:hypothetical protein